jgi:hypothetical protein
MKQTVICVIYAAVIIFAGMHLPAKAEEVRELLLFKPFQRTTLRPPAASGSGIVEPFSAPSGLPSGDGFFSRELLFDGGLDGDPNVDGDTPQGHIAPVGETPWWFLLISAAVVGMGIRWRKLRSKN